MIKSELLKDKGVLVVSPIKHFDYNDKDKAVEWLASG